MQDVGSETLGDFTPSVSAPPSSSREPEFVVHSEFEPTNDGRRSPYSGSVGHAGDSDETLVGVGILMQQDPKDGALYVKSCVRGGAAGPSVLQPAPASPARFLRRLRRCQRAGV
jgi:hypothetical protein